MKTTAQLLADSLYAAGISVVFGMPGGEVVAILEAMRQRGIRFELMHHETSAVFAADGYARATGGIGCVLTTLGPGATNAVAGVAHAWLDRAPVVVITAQKPDDLLPDYTHQVVDLHAIFAPITKRTVKISAANAATAIPETIALTTAGRPGPVHLQISNEEAVKVAGGRWQAVAGGDASHSEFTIHNSPFSISSFDSFLAAQRPVILAGLGLEPEAPYTALRELAEVANAPVIVLPKSKGALPDDHPLSAGTLGLTRTDPVYEILDEADCVLAVGFDVVELVKKWEHPAPLLWIANWANEDPVLPAVAEYVGPIGPILQQLSDNSFATDPAWGVARVQQLREKLAARSLPTPEAGKILPQSYLAAMRRHLPADGLLAVDVGSHKIFSSLEWPSLHPNRFFLSNGLSCMGFALPAAIGAAMARPDEALFCLIGDAGLAMCLGELSVLARLKLPVTVIVPVDNAIDLIRSHQMRQGAPIHGTEFPAPDFCAIAAAHGIPSAKVTNEAECDAALARAAASGGPFLVEVHIDPIGYPTTPRG
ncbi:MAG: thiamine pyrophosphate-binding protein [Chloroflexi bacterium]|nr:MAG: thiamine pyrophosphate-binding protein [Chloroflexota bacterium]